MLDAEGNPLVADPGNAQPSIDDLGIAGSSLLENSQVQGGPGVGEEKDGGAAQSTSNQKPSGIPLKATRIQDSSLQEGGGMGFGGSMSQR